MNPVTDQRTLDVINRLKTLCHAMDAEAAELRKDKARLDWLDSHIGTHGIEIGGPWRMSAAGTTGVMKIENYESGRVIAKGATYREALDAAMEAEHGR